MSVPRVNQIRRQIIQSNGLARYEVTTTVIDSGDLPFRELFVASITDPANPKSDAMARIATPRDLLAEADILYIRVDSTDIRTIVGDTFARVANVNDISQFARDRTQAVQSGASEFLTSTVTVLYETITTADAAYRTILDRLSKLVLEYRRYRDTFSTNPSRNYILPQVGLSAEDEFTAAFRERKAATTVARTARDAAVAAKKECELGCKSDKAILDMLVADIAFLERARALVTGFNETTVVTPAVNALSGTYTGSPVIVTTTPASAVSSAVAKAFCLNSGNVASYESLLIRKRALYEVKRTAVEACDANCRALGAAVVAAEAVLTGMQQQEEASLGRLLVVCPTFDSATVIV